MSQVITTSTMPAITGRPEVQQALQRLAAESRPSEMRTDAVELARGEMYRTQMRAAGGVAREAGEALSLTQTADAALGRISMDLGEMRGLAQQAITADSDADRSRAAEEFQRRAASIDETATNARYGDRALLDGSLSEGVSVATDGMGGVMQVARINDASTEALGVSGMSISSADSAQNAIGRIGAALESIADQRAGLALDAGRLGGLVRSMDSQSSAVRISDAAVGRDTAAIAQDAITNQAAQAVLAQASGISADRVMALLR